MLGSFAIADDANAQHDRVREACPGVVAWERNRIHDHLPTVDPSTITAPTLRGEIMKMAEDDQAVRNISPKVLASEGSAALEEVNKVDAGNLAKLRQIVKDHGIPTPHMIGDKGMEAFWMLVQHADHDPLLQQKVLTALFSDSRGLPLNEIALLIDRVQINRGEPQTYGTQFHREGGKFAPDPIRDSSELAARRKSMGLMPIVDYECVLRATYNER
ncbi:DUF6624 domain-containing protein [Dyella flagellata]|nr:DUF6624 domain-containing protein [Dyella flagellata]